MLYYLDDVVTFPTTKTHSKSTLIPEFRFSLRALHDYILPGFWKISCDWYFLIDKENHILCGRKGNGMAFLGKQPRASARPIVEIMPYSFPIWFFSFK
jgi:hypothetical protein